MPDATEPLLSLRDLRVTFRQRGASFDALKGVSLDVTPRRTLGLVGESGCGKSLTARAILQLLPPGASITGGNVLFGTGADAVDVAALPQNSRPLRQIRGGRIGMVFQEPMASFSPVHTIGQQALEAVTLHLRLGRRAARAHVIDMLRTAGIPEAERRIDDYPHQLSGGLRQRAMIAIALSCRPTLLIADEPTTALDVTIQAQILALLRRLQAEMRMAVLLITHDLGVVAQTTDDVAVMYCGRVVETASTRELFRDPRHPYTRGLLRAVSRIGEGNAHRLFAIPGTVPSPGSPPPGCPFHPRCPDRMPGVCDVGPPPTLVQLGESRTVACHLYSTQPAVMHAAAGPEEGL